MCPRPSHCTGPGFRRAQRRAYDVVRCPLAACAGEIAWRLAVVDQHQIDLPAVLEGAEAVQSVAETLDFPLSRPTGTSAATYGQSRSRRSEKAHVPVKVTHSDSDAS